MKMMEFEIELSKLYEPNSKYIWSLLKTSFEVVQFE